MTVIRAPTILFNTLYTYFSVCRARRVIDYFKAIKSNLYVIEYRHLARPTLEVIARVSAFVRPTAQPAKGRINLPGEFKYSNTRCAHQKCRQSVTGNCDNKLKQDGFTWADQYWYSLNYVY